MPANLPPQYLEVEKKYREARDPSERLSLLREMLAVIPKHKGTEKLQGDLKKRISKLQNQVQKSRRAARRPYAFSIQREGAGQVVLIGPPNSGKSSILMALTHAEPEIAAYPYTTRVPVPGMMQFEDVQIQLVDTPPILEGGMEHWHVQLVRNADGALVVLDIASASLISDLELVERELARNRITLACLSSPGGRVSEQSEIKVIEKVLVLGNKLDLGASPQSVELLHDLLGDPANLILFSATTQERTGLLKRRVFELLELVRVYTKAPGKKPDLERPFVVPGGSTVLDVAKLVHKDFVTGLRFVRIWGSGAFDGQCVERDHIVQDGDIVELHA